jgi:hypothetical protein
MCCWWTGIHKSPQRLLVCSRIWWMHRMSRWTESLEPPMEASSTFRNDCSGSRYRYRAIRSTRVVARHNCQHWIPCLHRRAASCVDRHRHRWVEAGVAVVIRVDSCVDLLLDVSESMRDTALYIQGKRHTWVHAASKAFPPRLLKCSPRSCTWL